jgi:hypothetical protein
MVKGITQKNVMADEQLLPVRVSGQLRRQCAGSETPQMLNSEQNPEKCDATGLIVVMQLGK